jgi:hypothetical protein
MNRIVSSSCVTGSLNRKRMPTVDKEFLAGAKKFISA